MCTIHEYEQVQCGQCQQYHGPRNYKSLQYICRYAKHLGGFGLCNRIKELEIRRAGWKDCANCHNRHEVRQIWVGGQA